MAAFAVQSGANGDAEEGLLNIQVSGMDGTDLLLTVSVQLLGSELLDLIHERLGNLDPDPDTKLLSSGDDERVVLDDLDSDLQLRSSLGARR
eukprot:g22644.t1